MDADAQAGDAPLDVLTPDLWILVWQQLAEESDKGNFAATCRYAVCTLAVLALHRLQRHTPRAAQLAKQDRAAMQPVVARLYVRLAALVIASRATLVLCARCRPEHACAIARADGPCIKRGRRAGPLLSPVVCKRL